jgi:hypothetical protein
MSVNRNVTTPVGSSFADSLACTGLAVDGASPAGMSTATIRASRIEAIATRRHPGSAAPAATAERISSVKWSADSSAPRLSLSDDAASTCVSAAPMAARTSGSASTFHAATSEARSSQRCAAAMRSSRDGSAMRTCASSRACGSSVAPVEWLVGFPMRQRSLAAG